jgi:ribonuclease BN (tRNA processing enzyme)
MEGIAVYNFDTHEFVKELKKAGFKENQAEIIVKMLSKSREYDVAHLVTKEQVKELERLIEEKAEKKFKALEKIIEEKFQTLEKEVNVNKEAMNAAATKAQLANLQTELIKWAVGSIVGITGLLLGLIQWLT